MTGAMQQLLEWFDALTEVEKQQAIAEVLRRALDLTPAALSDDELVEAADELFLALDAREAKDAQP